MAYIRTERIGMSPDEQTRRLKRLGRDMQQGMRTEDLRTLGFTWGEINDARRVFKIDECVRRGPRRD